MIATTSAYTTGPLGIQAIYEGAGARVCDVQRMTLEEIFVATVMSKRRELAA